MCQHLFNPSPGGGRQRNGPAGRQERRRVCLARPHCLEGLHMSVGAPPRSSSAFEEKPLLRPDHTGLARPGPRPDHVAEVRPVLPEETWVWFCLDCVKYHAPQAHTAGEDSESAATAQNPRLITAAILLQHDVAVYGVFTHFPCQQQRVSPSCSLTNFEWIQWMGRNGRAAAENSSYS
jgi:hypothetical protein